jgi:tetratricopeptide (TPR) repeat protein
LDLLTRDAGYQHRMLFVALKGQWLRAVGRPEAIPALVDQLASSIHLPADRPRERAWVYAQIGSLFSSLQMHDHAEPWLRELVSVQPNAYPSLARTLCVLKRHQEALDLCLANQPDPLTVEFVQNVVFILTMNEPPAEVFARAEPVLKAAMDQHGQNADMLVAIATACVVQERYAESAELFEKANQLRPKDVVTLNNLATLLGEMPGEENKALGYINEAIEVAGEQSILLDTKGMILIRLGDVPQAVKTLEQAVAEPSSDPRFYFHLAVAYDRNGAADDARRTLTNALSSGLESSVLTKQDKQLLGELKRKLLGT